MAGSQRGPQPIGSLESVWAAIPAYIYRYICCAVKLLTGPSLGVFKVINWAKSKLLTGPRSSSHYKNGFRAIFFAQLSLCVFFCS